MHGMKTVFVALLALFSTLEAAPYTLIWQANPKILSESEWVRECLSDLPIREVDDQKFQVVEPNSIIVICRYWQDPAIVDRYLRAFEEKGYLFGVIHLGDEDYTSPIDFYPRCAFVLRHYWKQEFQNSPHVMTFPLGFRNGFWSSNSPEKLRESHLRSLVWSFAGQVTKSSREHMVRCLKQIKGDRFLHETRSFVDSNALVGQKYRAMLGNTLFAPCPRGWWNLDSFRVYEALECGAIPIVEKGPIDYFSLFFGDHPFLTVESWDEAPTLVRQLMANPEQLEKRRQACADWWQACKADFKNQITTTIRKRFDVQKN
jgi:hypothetical protein